MEIVKTKKSWLQWLSIIIGTGMLAIAIKCIDDPIGLVTGGFTGIAIIVKQLTVNYIKGGIPLWLTNIVLNIPFFLISLRLKGISFIAKTISATFLLSGWLLILPEINLVGDDYLLASVFGGLISGVGMGMIFMAKATTGGTDMVAALIQHKIKHYTIAQIMQVLDAFIVLVGFYLFGAQATLYAIVYIFIVAKVSDAVMEGLRFSKAAFIITDNYEEVAKIIMDRMDRGITGFDAKGMYTGEKKCMLYCVVSKKEIVILKEIVLGIDKNAFVIVTDAREVLGEGFIEYHN